MASAKKIIGGLGKVRERFFSKPVPLSSADNALPLVLPRANLSSDFINAEAERVARQMLGEHVTSGRPKETFNLAGRSMKESERVKGLDYVLKPTGTVAKEVPYSPKRGEVKVALPGDQTVSDKTLESLEGVSIDSPQQGGAYYGLGQKHLDDPEFWKSGESAAKGVQGKIDRVADYYEPDRVVGTHLAMGQASNNFAMHFADANLKAIDWSKAEPKKISVFDNIVAGGYVDQKGQRVTFPQWPGLADPEAALKVMSEDSNLRKWFNNRMKVPSITEPLGLPNGLDIQYAITEPRIRDMEINMTGLMTGEMKPKALVEAAGAPHNTYTHRILGEAQGSQEVLTPFAIDFPDAAAHIASTKRPSDFTGTIQKVFPHQIVDDQYINQYNQYRDRIKQLTGKKDGGAIQDDDQELKAMIADHLDNQAHDQELRAMVDNHLAGGGAPKAIAKGFKKLFGNDVLPAVERDANKAKFLSDSKVKDRLFHGTKAHDEYADDAGQAFSQFTGRPTWLAKEPYTASGYSAGAGSTYPVYAQVKNPLNLRFDANDDAKKAFPVAKRLGVDIDHMIRMRKPDKAWEVINDPAFVDAVESAGHDGLMINEGGYKTYGVFEPNKIKSDIGNRGTYDINEADINKADGGSIGNLSKAAQENLAKLRELRAKIAPVADAWAAKQAEDANKYTRDIQPFKMPINKAAGGKVVKGAAKGFKKLFEDAPSASQVEKQMRLNMMPTARIGLEAPGILIPSKMNNVREAVRNMKGNYGARRVERAADEIPNLERMYQEDALKQAFTGDNAAAMMTIDPSRFEEFATPISSTFTRANSVRHTSAGDMVTFPEYLDYLKSVDGFDAVPFLEINKQLQGTMAKPYVSGHEGRHRNRAMSQSGEKTGLVQLLPRSELREPFPRRTQEEYIEALKKELEMTGNVVLPQINKNQPHLPQRPAIDLPDIYAEGGIAHMGKGGKLVKGLGRVGSQLFGNADEVAPAIKGGTRKFGSNDGGLNIMNETGGNWLTGSVEKGLQPLRRRTPGGKDPVEAIAKLKKDFPENTDPYGVQRPEYVSGQIGRLEQDVALNKWVDSNLTNYVKKQMGTADDPVRKLAEEGIVHIPSEQVGVNRYRAPQKRQELGRPQLGQSDAAKAWEDASDVAVNTPTAKTIKENDSLYQANPWIDKLSNEERVYALNQPASSNSEVSGLGFDHIMDVLRQDVAAGRIRPEQLNKVSMEQAVRRTHEFDQEMARRMAEAQIKNTAGMPTHKEYPDQGFKWIQLSHPEDLPKGWTQEASGAYISPTGERTIVNPSRQTLDDALKYEGDTMGHCVGSYCDDVAEGRTNIYSLRDAKGEPHVTIEVQPDQSILGFRNAKENYPELYAKYSADKNKYSNSWRDFLRQEAPEVLESVPKQIVQIKGKGNAKPKEEYLPFVQDFVKSGQWSDVGDIQNTGLLQPSQVISPKTLEALKAKGVEIPNLLTKEEADELGKQAVRASELPTIGDTFGQAIPPEGMAEGGGAFKKIQFMDKGGVTTSGGDFSSEDVGADSYFSDEFKRRLAGLKEDSKTQMEKEYKQLSRAGGKKDLALRVGAQLAGGLPDILNMGLEGVDYLQSKVPALSKPASVLDSANSKDRVPKFSLSSENPWLGSERIMESLKEAKLLGNNEYPFIELASNFAVPAGAAALIKGGKKSAKGVKAMTSKPQGGLSATAR